MKKSLYLLSLLVLIISNGFGQQAPSWVNKLPQASNDTYIYVREFALGNTENEARSQAIARVFQSTALRIGQPISSDEIFRAIQNTTDYEVISSTYNIPINKVCEYSIKMRNNQYKVYVLCQVAKVGNIQPIFESFEDCYKTKQYSNTAALFKSMVIPGLGQIGKRHYTEGFLTLTGELLFVSTGVTCYYLSQDKLDIMNKENVSYNDFDDARKKYNFYKTTSYFAWGGAAALYVFNLYRAFFCHPNYKETLALYPSMNVCGDNLAFGFSLQYKF